MIAFTVFYAIHPDNGQVPQQLMVNLIAIIKIGKKGITTWLDLYSLNSINKSHLSLMVIVSPAFIQI